MTKALFTYDYGVDKMNKISDLGYEVILKSEKNLQVDNEILDIEVLVCYNPFDTLDIESLKKLKWIQLSSIGIDQIPKEYVLNSEIILCNNKGGYSIPMGEWVALKVLEGYKDSKYFYKKQEKKEYKINTKILELKDKTIGFIGTGTIAKESVKRLKGFDMRILGVNTSGHPVENFDDCFPICELEEFLRICDVVVCTIPYTKQTHHLLNGKMLASMKSDSILINVSRGSIIDEESLIIKLKENKFRSVALDVFEEEPLLDDNPLWDFERVYISPHNSWVSEMRNERRFELIYENMRRYKSNEPLINVVDIERGY